MSYLSIVEETLPPGFRFHPRDEELVCDYLAKKLYETCTELIDVDLNKCEPWDLPEMACVGGKEWYFFNLRDRKYATGQRTNRATVSGYWKATGKDRCVTKGGALVGMRKTLVFYEGRAPKGKKTNWVMHEFRMEGPSGLSMFPAQEDWVLCRVFYKSRGHSSKPITTHGTATNYEDNSSSSSLPPLMETFITFNGHAQTPVMSFEGYNQQVPCFSNPLSIKEVQPNFWGLNEFYSGFNPLNQLDCDKKVIREVLNQLTRWEGNNQKAPSLGEGNLGTARQGQLRAIFCMKRQLKLNRTFQTSR